MSLFIAKENQDLLWKTIHKTPLVDTVFKTFPPNVRMEWFKKTVESFHLKTPEITNPESLARMNRDVIAFMVKDLHAASKPAIDGGKNVRFGIDVSKQQPPPQSMLTNSIITEPVKSASQAKGEAFQLMYMTKQKEFESMNQRPLVPELDFTEIKEDRIIENMEELIKEQLRQRELDIIQFAPPIAPAIQPPVKPPLKLSIGDSIHDPIQSIALTSETPDRITELEKRIAHLETILATFAIEQK